ncbi:MAG TPA: hypothetical protein VGI75_14515 [Pirellulales bacterium]
MALRTNHDAGIELSFMLWLLAVAAAVLAIARDSSASTFAAPINLGTVTAPAIKEASGMVASLNNPGVLWIENDSGNENAIYAINLRGQLLGTYTLTGAANDDWEDMSIGPGPEPGVNYLYLMNSATSSGFQGSQVVRVPEPTVYASQQVGAPVTENISGARMQSFLWPAPNSEAMFVDRQTGDIYLGSKESNTTKFYMATAAQFTATGSQTMTHVVDVPLSKGNGASISYDGSEILVRNQDSTALLYHRGAGQTIAQALVANSPTNPDHVTVNGTNVEPNAEIIALDPDGNDFYTFSEGTDQKLYKYVRTSNDAPPAHRAILAPGSTWKYLDGGAIPAANWNQPAFDDSAWSSGSGPFGYGQGSEHATLSYGGNASNKPAAAEFRITFNVTDPGLLSSVTVNLLVDDGAAVYLNGTEIDRFNLAAGAGLTNFAQTAESNDFQNTWRSFTIDRDLLKPTGNVLAVEVHGSSPTDNDLRFDLQVSGLPGNPMPGDFDLDGRMTNADLQAMISALASPASYKSAHGLSDLQWDQLGDFNGDGSVTVADISPFMQSLAGMSAGGSNVAAVPEPSGLLLASWLATATFLRRRRGVVEERP